MSAGRHRRGWSPAVVTTTAILALLLLSALALWRLTDNPVPVATVSPAPAPDIVNPMGTVTRVLDADVVTVDLADRQLVVHILGLADMGPGACGRELAIERANETLVGQPVTLVNDPTVAARDEQGRVRAYVVLHSQLSYTDKVISEGVMEPPIETLWYSPVFEREADEAAAAGRGIYGAPCRVRR